MENKMRKLVHNLDSELGGILLNVESVKTLKDELGRTAEDMENTNTSDITSVMMQFRESEHTIRLVNDLLGYVAKELDSNYKNAHKTHSELFQSIVKEGK